jgi:hypothetical protein
MSLEMAGIVLNGICIRWICPLKQELPTILYSCFIRPVNQGEP